MEEFLNILKDIKSGALPASELPGFIVWWLRKADWLWLALILILVTRFVRRLVNRLIHHVAGTSIRSNLNVR